MATAVGRASYLQVGREAAYGTAVASTARTEFIRWNVSPNVGIIRDPSLYNQIYRRSLIQGATFMRGQLGMRLNYVPTTNGTAILHLFDSAFGGTTFGSQGAAGTAGPPGIMTFQPKANNNSMTIQVDQGGVEAASKVQRFLGTIWKGFTVRGTAGQDEAAMVQVEFDLFGKSYDKTNTPTAALTAPTVDPVLFHHATVTSFGETAYTTPRVRSFELIHQNNLAEDRFYLGSVNPLQAVRGDFASTQLRLTMEFDDIEMYDDAYNFATNAANINLTFAKTGDAVNNIYEFLMPKAKPVAFSVPVENYGILVATQTWEAFQDGTGSPDTGLQLKITSPTTFTAGNY